MSQDFFGALGRGEFEGKREGEGSELASIERLRIRNLGRMREVGMSVGAKDAWGILRDYISPDKIEEAAAKVDAYRAEKMGKDKVDEPVK